MLNQTDTMLNGTSMLLKMTHPGREETQVTVLPPKLNSLQKDHLA